MDALDCDADEIKWVRGDLLRYHDDGYSWATDALRQWDVLVAEVRRLEGENTQLRTALAELIETGNEACQFPDGESVKRFDKAMMAARVALGENP